MCVQKLVRWKRQTLNVIITQNMRPNNSNNNNPAKTSRNSPMPSFPGHTNSNKQLKSKSNKSIEKNSNKSPAQNVLKNARLQQSEAESSQSEYFTVDKDRIVKNSNYQKNDDYCIKVRSGNSGSKIDSIRDNNKKDDKEYEIMNKLKFNKTKLVIGFDGKPVSVEPTVGRFTSENRSLEQFTDFYAKTEYSRTKDPKAKSKSQPKRSKNKVLPKSQSKKKLKGGPQTKQKKTDSKQMIYSIQSETVPCRNSIGRCQKFNTQSKQETVTTQPSTPHLHQFSQFYTEQFDLQVLKSTITSETCCLSLNYLKRISKQARSDCINFLSRICSQAKLSKDIFFLAVELVDRYCNQQIMLNKFKVLGIASLLLCVKFYDQVAAQYISEKIFMYSIDNLNMSYKQVESENNNHRCQKQDKLKKEQHQAIIVNTLIKLYQILPEQLKPMPSSEQILEFQTLILIKENYRIHRNSLAYWIDLLTLHWDRYLYGKLQGTDYTAKCLFRLPEQPQNYYLLVQIVQSCLHKLEIYKNKYPHLILTTIFLLCRISIAAESTSSMHHAFSQYKTNLQKSNNMLFIDKYGINAIFGEFLELVDMQIGDILGCCKFVSQFLNPNLLEIVDKDRSRDIVQSNLRAIFNQHYYNPDLAHAGDQG